MDKKRAIAFLASGLFMVSTSASAIAAAAQTVHFATCTFQGVEAGCVLARSGGAVYNVTAIPGVKAYQWLQGTGTVVNKATFCMQGRVIGKFVPDKSQELIGCLDLRNRAR